MSIAAVVGRGYGPDASIAFVVTRGYGAGSGPPPSPPPPAVDEHGVQSSGGGRPKKRPTLHLEGYRPEIVDPREYFAKRKPADARAPVEPEAERLPIVEPDLPPLPDVPRRMPDGLAMRVEATITAAERKRALAELAADDEEAILAIIFAALT